MCTHIQVHLPLQSDIFSSLILAPSLLQFLSETRGSKKWCLKAQSLETDDLGLNPCSAMLFTNLNLNKSFNFFVTSSVIFCYVPQNIVSHILKNHHSWFCGMTGLLSWVILYWGPLRSCNQMASGAGVIQRLNWTRCPKWLTHMAGRRCFLVAVSSVGAVH